MNAVMKRILLVRHAECEMNLDVAMKVGGQSNASPLTSLGVIQAQVLGRYLARSAIEHNSKATDGPVQVVGYGFSSTAVRARDTAQLVMTELQIPVATLTQSDDILELHQGSWEGALRADCYTPATLAATAADPWHFAPPGGESQHSVEVRVLRFIQEVVLPATCSKIPSLVVSHGLAIKCLLRAIMQSDPRMTRKIQLHNTSITEVGWVEEGTDAGWHVLRINDTAHLQLATLL